MCGRKRWIKPRSRADSRSCTRLTAVHTGSARQLLACCIPEVCALLIIAWKLIAYYRQLVTNGSRIYSESLAVVAARRVPSLSMAGASGWF